jgi:hypothetical protein
MGKILPMYRRGLLVDYPTNIAARAGSCIFIHVWRAPDRGTGGCVSMPEARLEALQDLPRAAAPCWRLCRACSTARDVPASDRDETLRSKVGIYVN